MKIWVGFDAREELAARVCRHSIQRFWPDAPVEFLSSDRVKDAYTRTHHVEHGQMIDDIDGRPFSTDFAFNRFLVPWLQNYDGWAMFSDCDFLFLSDVRDLFEVIDEDYAVMCVKHNHEPKNGIKMDGRFQTAYRRKNWSSLVLWNCAQNRSLGRDEVNRMTGADLHGFSWLNDDRIGSLPEEWNWLANLSPTTGNGHGQIKAVHYTEGGPWLSRYRDCEFAENWRQALEEMKVVV